MSNLKYIYKQKNWVSPIFLFFCFLPHPPFQIEMMKQIGVDYKPFPVFVCGLFKMRLVICSVLFEFPVEAPVLGDKLIFHTTLITLVHPIVKRRVLHTVRLLRVGVLVGVLRKKYLKCFRVVHS
jgi:hypothetical protein